MKKTIYLLLVLFVCVHIALIGQSQSHGRTIAENEQLIKLEQVLRPDYRANKTALDEMKSVREMIMRSDNPVFKSRALRQVNEQMREMLLGDKAEALNQPEKLKRNLAKTKSSNRFALNMNSVQTVSEAKTKPVLTGNERRKVSFDGVMKYRLDSLIFSSKDGQDWLPEGKQEFAYNYNAQVTSSDDYVYDSSVSDWGNRNKSTITYNEAGQVTMYLQQWWENDLERWIVEYKQILEYNANGDLILQEAYSEDYDEDSSAYVYRGEWKNVYGFDANNQEISSIYYSWDFENADWIPESKNEYNYENGMELMFAGYMWDREKNLWIGHWKFEYTFVPGIDLLNSIYYHWNYETDVWYIQEKTEYALSTNQFGLAITETRWYTHYETGELVYEIKTEYSNPYGVIEEDLYKSFRSIINYQWDLQKSEWVVDNKTDNTFDAYGNITLRQDSAWRNLSEGYAWIIQLEIDANVNAEGKISDYVVTNWKFDGVTHSIYEKIQYLNTYNTKLELIAYINQIWDFDNEIWINNSKMEFAYDESGRLISQIWLETFNPVAMQWIPSRKIEMDYNADGSDALSAYYDWNPVTQNWRLTGKTENRIDAYGETILELSVQWNNYVNREVINYKREKEYDAQRNLTMESYIMSNTYWDGSQFYVYSEGEMTTYVYDTSDRLTSSIEYEYVQDEFVPDEKFEYTYNTTYPTALDTEIKYLWNDGDWVKERKGDLTSDFDITRNNLILPFGDDGGSREVAMYFNYMATQLLEYKWVEDNESGDWVEDFKAVLYFAQSEFSEVDRVNLTDVSVYPNPVSDYLTVRLKENVGAASFRLFDVQGKMLYQVPVHNHQSLDLSKFQNGLYFYQLTMDNETISGKLLKK